MAHTQNTQKSFHFIVVAGGSAGHLYPAESLHHALHQKGHTTFLVTNKRVLKFVQAFSPKNKTTICCSTPFHKSIIKNIVALFLLGIGFLKSLWILLRQNPNAVIGFGGYVSFPVLMAAFFLRIPIAIQEQNSVLGRVNRLFASRAFLIATAFKDVRYMPKKACPTITGTPMRPCVLTHANHMYQPWSQKSYDHFKILVFGGSHGAAIFCTVLKDVFANIKEEHHELKFSILQQCRENEEDKLRSFYKKNNIQCHIQTFFKNIPQYMATAHLVIARAGASTIGELAIIGCPSILIPLANTLDQDQLTNAQHFEEAGGCVVIEEKDFYNKKHVKNCIIDAIRHPLSLVNLAQRAKEFGHPDASKKIINKIVHFLVERK